MAFASRIKPVAFLKTMCLSRGGMFSTRSSFQWSRWGKWKGIAHQLPWRSISVSTSIMLGAVPVLFKEKALPQYSSILSPSVPAETSRVMLPDDTNPMGNVHGGTILKLMEQAGMIVSMRHCNQERKIKRGAPLITVLARMNQTDFYQPMHVGEIAHVHAAVTYTSKRSIEVTVDVYAENPLTGSRRHTNSARLWYVAVPANVNSNMKQFEPQEVPQLTGISEKEAATGRNRYYAQKEARKVEEDMFSSESTKFDLPDASDSAAAEPGTVAASSTTLVNVVVPSDCLQTGHMMGGALMKIMDTAAGICAVRHSHSLAVTACMDAINFHSPVLLGEIVTTKARVVFTSKRSMVIEVVCEAEGLRTEGTRVTNTSYFTFVSLDKNYKAQDVRLLKTVGLAEEKKFAVMKGIYEKKKKDREASKKKT